jgi:hypothetical protein
VVLLLAAAGLTLLVLARPLWFVMDDWAFLLHRRITFTGDLPLQHPHNEHLVMLPVVIFRVLYSIVGMHSYLPYVGLNIVFHLGACAVFAVLLRRHGASAWVVAVMMVPAAFSGPGGTDILWDFQMGFVLPSLLGLVAILVVDLDRPRRRAAILPVWALLVAALMCSGAGVTTVALVSAYTLLRRGWRTALLVASAPTGLFLLWYAGYGRGTAIAPPVRPQVVLPFVWRGTSNLWDQVLHVPWVGSVVLLAIIAVTVLDRRHQRLRMMATSGLLGLAFNFLLLAVSRGGWGVDASLSPRYLYVGVLLTLPAVALALQVAWELLRSRRWARGAVFGAVAVVLLVLGLQGLASAAQAERALDDGIRDRVLAAAQMAARGEEVLTPDVSPVNAPDLDYPLLKAAAVQGRLPGDRPTRAGRLAAAGSLKVAVSPTTLGLAAPDHLRLTGSYEIRNSTRNCRLLETTPSTRLWVPRDSEVTLVMSTPTVATRLRTQRVIPDPEKHSVTPGTRYYVGSVAREGRLVVMLRLGSAKVCAGQGTDWR